ncbi:alpha/beta hydrolase [soil metagenome]
MKISLPGPEASASSTWQRLARRLSLGISGVIGALLATSCSPLRLAEALMVGDHFVQTVDIPYSEGEMHRLDVYTPRGARGQSPVIVFLYGGRWQNGSRDQYRLLGDALTRRGVVVVVPDYRLYPDTIFPGWVEDGAQAVLWTQQNIQSFGGDPSSIFIVGHSAGAHTAVLLGLDERWLRGAGVDPQVVQGIVSIAGPVDTSWTDPDVQALMGPQDGWPATYPASHLRPDAPPILLLHGEGDRTVSATNSTRLAARLHDRGGCARAILYPRVGHVEIVLTLAAPWLRRAPVRENILSFLEDPRSYAGCS